MRRHTTYYQRLAARRQRAMRRARVFRWPFHPNEEAQHHIGVRMVGAALSDPAEGMRALSRVGVFSFTRWQRLLLKIPYRRTLRMQRYILKNLRSR